MFVRRLIREIFISDHCDNPLGFFSPVGRVGNFNSSDKCPRLRFRDFVTGSSGIIVSVKSAFFLYKRFMPHISSETTCRQELKLNSSPIFSFSVSKLHSGEISIQIPHIGIALKLKANIISTKCCRF